MRTPAFKSLMFTILALGIIAPALAQQAVSIPALVHHPDQYDRKTISVTGTIAAYTEHVSARGNEYTNFRLVDSGASISVFVRKHPGLHNAQRVKVIGVFAQPKRFHYLLEAQRIEVLQ